MTSPASSKNLICFSHLHAFQPRGQFIEALIEVHVISNTPFPTLWRCTQLWNDNKGCPSTLRNFLFVSAMLNTPFRTVGGLQWCWPWSVPVCHWQPTVLIMLHRSSESWSKLESVHQQRGCAPSAGPCSSTLFQCPHCCSMGPGSWADGEDVPNATVIICIHTKIQVLRTPRGDEMNWVACSVITSQWGASNSQTRHAERRLLPCSMPAKALLKHLEAYIPTLTFSHATLKKFIFQGVHFQIVKKNPWKWQPFISTTLRLTPIVVNLGTFHCNYLKVIFGVSSSAKLSNGDSFRLHSSVQQDLHTCK